MTCFNKILMATAAASAVAYAGPASPVPPAISEGWAEQRNHMIESQIIARGIKDPAVIDALRNVPRERFIPETDRPLAYGDHPVPIGHGQTISQPYIVAYMTELLQVRPGHRVLEIGTGSGYQAAVLARMTDTVHTIEIVEPLHRRASAILPGFGIPTDRIVLGDGYAGLPDEAPFDRIIVTAAPPKVPQPLIDQLAPGGRMVVPVGPTGETQQLLLITRDQDGRVQRTADLFVRFVPMTGEAQK